MKPQAHFIDAVAWMAKAPPMGVLPFEQSALVTEAVVLQFPAERVRHGQKVGLAGGAKVVPLHTTQPNRWRNRHAGDGAHAGQ